MSRKQSARTSKWAVMVALVLLLATTSLTAAQSPDLLLPLVTGEGQTDQVEPGPPLVEEAPPLEPDPNAPVGDSGDTNSGDYDVPTQEASVNAFNAAQWTVQNNVGIGTDAPTEPLDIARNVNNYTRLLVRNPHAGTIAQTQLYLNTASSTGLVVQQFGSGYTATWNGLSLKNMARLRTTPTVKGLILTTGGAYPLILGTSDQERMRILSGGNVGIGTTTPAHRLSIAGGPAWTGNNWTGALALPNDSAIGWHPNSSGLSFGMGHATNGFYIFRTLSAPGTTGTSASYDLTIADNGNVGIGTTTPQASYKLHVKGSTLIESDTTGVAVDEPGGAGVIVNHPGTTGVFVNQPGNSGVFVNQPGSYGLYVVCPCGDATFPNSGVFVYGGNIRVEGGSFIDSGTTLNVPDYVFEPEYPLLSLDELRTYVTEEKHLPNVPNEEEIRAGGLDLSDFQMKLLEKTEELTLYTLAQDEQIESLQQENQGLQQTNQAQDEQIESLQQVVELLQQQNADLEARLAALEEQE